MTDTYQTIARTAQTKTVIKKSSFLAFAEHIADEAQVQALIRTYRHRFYDARHVCYAYIIRWSPTGDASQAHTVEKSSDGGEPSGTAGRPILGAIRSARLENVLVVVVRYFGGILLGTPGLIAAYREAARCVLESAGSVTQTQLLRFAIRFPYSQMNPVMKLLKQHPVKILSNQADLQCALTIETPASAADTLAQKLNRIPSVQIDTAHS